VGFDVAPGNETFLFEFELPHATISREELICLAHWLAFSGTCETRH
jgi:hypothetical protein